MTTDTEPVFYYQAGDEPKRRYSMLAERCSIGSDESNDLSLSGFRLSARHAEVYRREDVWYLRDLDSASGCWVNRRRVRQHGPLASMDDVSIGEVQLFFDHAAVLDTATTAPSQSEGPDAVSPVNTEFNVEFETHSPTGDERLNRWSRVIHEQLLQQMDLRRKDVSRMSDVQLREESFQLVSEIVERYVTELPTDLNVAHLIDCVLDEALGLGPLEQFLADDSISEIMVNNHAEIFIERYGRIEQSPIQFSSDRTVYSVIERILTPLGRRIDESSPIVDARLKDGSRVNAVIPPLALKGPSLTVRKFPQRRLGFADLLAGNTLSREMIDFLSVCVRQRKNIVVSGGTGSGKTTLLNVLSSVIPDAERIVTIEDAAELKLNQPNLVSLESRPPNLEGQGAVPIRDLVRNALRMRPDRIVVGECRGGEAIDMLQAMNTGHDGSLTTVHANTPRDVISRLEVLAMMAGLELPVTAIREQIAAAIHIIVQQTRFPCGGRRITCIAEVTGMEGDMLQLQELFVFRRSGVDQDGGVIGQFCATGDIPIFYESLLSTGHELDLQCFETDMRRG